MDHKAHDPNALHAWVIHKQFSGETSVNVTFFTAERGLLTCLCKGGRMPKKQGLLQPFTPLWVFVNAYPNRIYTQRIENEAPTIPLAGEALFSGLYINELLYHALKTDSPNQPLFEAYLSTLKGLSLAENRQEIEPLLRRFEWMLLDASGYALSLTHEAKTGLPITAIKNYQFIEGLGLVNASQGLSGFHLLAMSQDNLTHPETLKVAKYLMRKAINYLLEGVEIQARKLYNQTF
jgi:DNA repair protein RecO (recombination protein O)